MPNKPPQKRDCTVYLPVPLFEAIDRLALKQGQPRSTLIANILQTHINQLP